MNDSWIRIDRDTNITGYIKRYAIILKHAIGIYQL